MVSGICQLCLFKKELQDSHLMPAGIYRRTRSPGSAMPHPLAVTVRGVHPSSEQVRDYVFCADCEHRFNTSGENYVLRLVSTRASFPLLDQLQASAHTTLGKEWRGYAERDTPGINRRSIAYFALSVFWRASAHRWKLRDGRIIDIDLGPRYSEAARRYLLGESGFPANMTLFVVACTDKTSQDVFFMPNHTGRFEGCWGYSFGARGIAFMLTIGKQMPTFTRTICCITSPEKWIFTCDSEDRTLEALRAIVSKQAPQKRRNMSSNA